MAKQETFKVSKTGVEPVEVTWNKPENVDDPAWEAIGVSKDAINELACQSVVIKMQGSGRGSLGEGQAAVQTTIDGWKYGQRVAGTRKVVKLEQETIKKAKFTKEQLEMLKLAGVQLPGMEEEEAAAA